MSDTPAETAPSAPSGQVFHMLADDELSLTSVYDGPEGVATVTIGWGDLETARDNHLNAVNGFDKRLADIVQKIIVEQNSRQRLRRVGRFNVLLNTGAPIWWLPKARLKDGEGRRELAFGWLYAAVHVFPRSRHEAPAA